MRLPCSLFVARNSTPRSMKSPADLGSGTATIPVSTRRRDATRERQRGVAVRPWRRAVGRGVKVLDHPGTT